MTNWYAYAEEHIASFDYETWIYVRSCDAGRDVCPTNSLPVLDCIAEAKLSDDHIEQVDVTITVNPEIDYVTGECDGYNYEIECKELPDLTIGDILRLKGWSRAELDKLVSECDENCYGEYAP